jgi:hypothetical protein
MQPGSPELKHIPFASMRYYALARESGVYAKTATGYTSVPSTQIRNVVVVRFCLIGRMIMILFSMMPESPDIVLIVAVTLMSQGETAQGGMAGQGIPFQSLAEPPIGSL